MKYQESDSSGFLLLLLYAYCVFVEYMQPIIAFVVVLVLIGIVGSWNLAGMLAIICFAFGIINIIYMMCSKENKQQARQVKRKEGVVS